MSTTPRPTDWAVPDAVLVAIRQERNALVAKVAAYKVFVSDMRDRHWHKELTRINGAKVVWCKDTERPASDCGICANLATLDATLEPTQ